MIRTFEPFNTFAGTPANVAYDVLRTDEGVQLFIDLPGINPDAVELTVDGRVLSLKAERVFDVPEGATLLSRRRTAKTIDHSFQLGDSLDAERLEADYAFGVLKVTVPVAESAKPRKVNVAIGTSTPQVEAA